MPRKSRDWIIINTGRGGRLECLRCGRFHQPSYPIEAWALSALSKGFEKEHARCEPRPEGLHCTMCGQTGHKPEACPNLGAKTPEQWLAGPDTGISSCTIYGVLYADGGYVHRFGEVWADVPHDPADFGRCHRLLKLFPAWRARLGEVADKHPKWRPLVEHWDELEALYGEELPSGTAPKLWARMRELAAEATP